MRRLVLVLALTVAAACAPERPSEIETDLNQRVETAGLTGAALADAYIDRGILYLATKKPDAALADFDQAIATAPEAIILPIAIWILSSNTTPTPRCPISSGSCSSRTKSARGSACLSPSRPETPCTL